jgi:iron-sulfur cluster insertion protein
MDSLDQAANSQAPAGAPVVVTDSAARRIATLMGRETNPEVFLRVAVLGGGCSGFQYTFNFDDARTEDDMVIAKDGAVVVIDSTSLDLLRGSQIDFVEDMVGSAFAIKNPNATSSCGCGNSFSV